MIKAARQRFFKLENVFCSSHLYPHDFARARKEHPIDDEEIFATKWLRGKVPRIRDEPSGKISDRAGDKIKIEKPN